MNTVTVRTNGRLVDSIVIDGVVIDNLIGFDVTANGNGHIVVRVEFVAASLEHEKRVEAWEPTDRPGPTVDGVIVVRNLLDATGETEGGE